MSIRLSTPATQDAPPRAPAQDLQRHKPRAAANHLSPAEMTKRDAGAVDEDAAALAKVQASRLPKPPHLHRYVAGACKVCGVEQPGGAA